MSKVDGLSKSLDDGEIDHLSIENLSSDISDIGEVIEDVTLSVFIS